jgi:hypothetical protein
MKFSDFIISSEIFPEMTLFCEMFEKFRKFHQNIISPNFLFMLRSRGRIKIYFFRILHCINHRKEAEAASRSNWCGSPISTLVTIRVHLGSQLPKSPNNQIMQSKIVLFQIVNCENKLLTVSLSGHLTLRVAVPEPQHLGYVSAILMKMSCNSTCLA